MRGQRGQHRGPIARGDGLEQPAVPFDTLGRRPVFRLAAQVGRHVQLQLQDDRLEGHEQLALPGQRYHFDMKPAVGLVLAEGVVGLRRGRHGVPGSGEAGQGPVAGQRQSELHGVAFEQTPQPEQLVHVRARQLGNPDAAPG
jgi:hypothetical protein